MIVIFDPVDGSSRFLLGIAGRRLINVAASRAMAHLVMMFTASDRANLALANLVSNGERPRSMLSIALSFFGRPHIDQPSPEVRPQDSAARSG